MKMKTNTIRLRWVLAAALAAAPATSWAAQKSYAVVPAERSVVIDVGKSGLFSFAGHTHEVVAPGFSGEVVADDEDLSRSRVTLVFDARALKVTGRGESAEDVPKVQEAMLGPKVLDAARFPEIRFVSKAVSGRALGPGSFTLDVAGELTLKGVTRPVALPLKVEVKGETLLAEGTTTLRQKDFGIQPVSVAGVVNVKNELKLTFRVEAREVR
jgi:polyisoprenoid-binding protein YceI